MKIKIINTYNNKWESVEMDFESKVPINTGTLRSLSELVTLKDIEREIREYLGLVIDNNRWDRIICTTSKAEVFVYDVNDFLRIKTIVKRDNIIKNILNDR